MERDPSGIIFALVMVAVATGLFLAVTRLRGRKAQAAAKPAEERAVREEQARLRKLVEQGTHVLLDGGAVAPKCFGCGAPATVRPHVWVRGSGLWDLIRRTFGAPAKVRVGQSVFAECDACDVCSPLLYEEFHLDLNEQLVERSKLEAEHETRRARFQRETVYERARAKIAKHEKEIGGRKRRSEVPAKVVPFVSSGRTGTDSK